MKRLLLLILLIAMIIPALQAQADSARQSHAKKIFMPDYYQKSKRQIQAGFVLAEPVLAYYHFVLKETSFSNIENAKLP
ncbi:MAG: hypothetical protein JST09_10530 [Bacteroidetes bacterium]|nr:hypothetical protein [Bacteroidota bacterium]